MARYADVVVVGAGIAALALAIELQKKGISTILLERQKGPEGIPRGLTFQPNGLAVLEKLEALGRAKEVGSASQILEVKSWEGEVLLEADYSLLEHPQNYLLTANATEIERLLVYLAEKAGAKVLWGTTFQELTQSEGRANGVVYEADGVTDQIQASVVVGADGPQSRVRTSLGSEVKTKKYPDSFLVGLVGPVPGLEGRARQYQSPGKMLGIMPSGPEATYLFHCVGPRSFDSVKKEGLGSFRTEVVQAAPEMADAFSGVEAWTKMAYFTPSYIRVKRWVGNGIALLGDAAHSFHPHAGQGVNLALEDAVALAEVIDKCKVAGDFSQTSLLPYQKERQMRADVIGKHANYTVTYALSDNWLIKRLNKRALHKLNKDKKLQKKALEITAGIFEKKPGLITLAKIGGILP
ncbi:MAG TPA: NAD(P)/FAD-dependent oxidoreductase [Candidatus Bathyarchaeia archaeon]|nr:NAD(P)/FAD-dependent oxidoreductase [Candidatus Bathyarchaeia archaeon]